MAEDPYWEAGAWKSVWVVDLAYKPNQQEYWMVRAINTPGNTNIGQSKGDVSYGIGTYELEVRCIYA